MPGVLRLPSTAHFALVRGEAEPTALAARVQARFAPAFGPDPCVVSVARAGPALTLFVVADTPVALEPFPSAISWGAPIGAAGDASDGELDGALEDAVAARSLLGRFCIARCSSDAAHLVTSAELSHTLKIVRGTRDAIASSGHLAAVLAGAPLRIAEERVAEFLALDFVMGDDELLAGVVTVDEASSVRITRDGVDSTSYWPIEQRCAPSAPASPDALWEQMVVNARRVFAAERAWLALTAGRDSTLLAAATYAAGASARCYTFGDAAYPDVRGASAVCDELGWTHKNIWRLHPVRISLRRVSAFSPWTDGLETARNLYGAPWPPEPSDVVAVSGHGGEIGRAFFWKNDPARIADLFELCRTAPQVVPPPWRDAMRDRLAAELTRCREVSPSNSHALDVFYARNRVRKWTGRGIRRPNFVGFVTGYGDPETVRLLLSIREEERRDGSFFDRAFACDTRDLRAVATRGATAKQPVPARRQGRVRGDTDLRDLARLTTRLVVGGLVTDMFGRRWAGSLLRRAYGGDNQARRVLWNAIAVEGLERSL